MSLSNKGNKILEYSTMPLFLTLFRHIENILMKQFLEHISIWSEKKLLEKNKQKPTFLSDSCPDYEVVK